MMPKRRTAGLFLASLLTLAVTGAAMTFAYGAESAAGATSAPGVSPSGSAASSGQALTDDAYIIQVDDILTIEGSPHVELRARICRVSEDGTIKMPYLELKRIKVVGRTKRQVEDRLEELYDPDYFKNLVITVEVRIKSYNIIGEVRNPGIKELLIQTTLLTAIASAGSFSEYAAEDKVLVIRNPRGKGDPSTHIVDCKAIMKGRAPDDFIVKPNDLIWVRRSGIFPF